MTEAFKELPDSWILSDLGELSEYVQRGKSPKYTEKSDLPVINQKCVRWWGVDTEHLKYIHDDQAPKWDEIRFLRPGDVLWNSTGTGTIGRACVYRGELKRVVVDSHVTIVRSDPKALEPRYAFYYIMSPLVQADIEEMQSGSTNQVELSKKVIVKKQIPLAPLPEQQRIVEKIETLFAWLDKGEEAVREVQKLLIRYRQSVLKSAVTGQLTADWRAEHKGELEDGEALLLQILEARRAGWPAKGKYKPPVEPNFGEFEVDIPSGWVWTSVDQILRAGLSNGRSVPDAEGEGFPVMRLTALKDGLIDISERKQGAWNASDAEPYMVEKGDILVSRGNGTKKLVGRGGLIADEVDPVAYPDTMIRIPIDLEHLSPEWFVQLWNSPFMRAQIEKAAKTTAGIYKINQGDIRGFVVPLPPPEEQRHIATLVADEIAKTADLERWCETELKRSASLRQSILKDAFAGRLVPQDPTDEPASALLARIADAKAPTKKTRRKVQA